MASMTTTTTNQALLTQVSPQETCKRCPGKVSIIGAGTVGTAIAFTLLAQKICNELVLIDKNEALARGETLDIQHATMYLDSPVISSSSEYSAAASSKICIVTAGARNSEEKKNVAARQNSKIYEEIIPQLVNYSPNCILVICSYPVDEMSWVAWKLSGFPPHRIIGSGTLLESARFRCLIAQRLEVHPTSCQAYIIGEQGSKSVPVWSSVSVAGVRLRDVNPDLGNQGDPEEWQSIHTDVVKSAAEVTKLKECCCWGLALSVARIVHAILEDTEECLAVSTHIKGCRHGVDKDVYMSLPCIIGCKGVKKYVKQCLNDNEKSQLQRSADRMYELQKSLGMEKPIAIVDC